MIFQWIVFRFSGDVNVESVGETEEERYQRLHYETIPDKLWDIFPAHGQYIVQLLKLGGYQSRETIVKLKDPAETKKMLSFAANHSFLLDEGELKQTFGLFAKEPKSVMILPGLEGVFQRFIKTVENIIPKKKQSNNKLSSPTGSSVKPKDHQVDESVNLKWNAKKLQDRLLDWIMKRNPVNSEDNSISMTRDEAGIS